MENLPILTGLGALTVAVVSLWLTIRRDARSVNVDDKREILSELTRCKDRCAECDRRYEDLERRYKSLEDENRRYRDENFQLMKRVHQLN